MKAFLKISFRHLRQNKLYAIINIIGLSTAIICMLLAILYWKDEHNYDTFHQNNPDLFRIVSNIVNKDGSATSSGGTGQVQGPAFKAEVAGVENYVRVMGGAIYSDISANGKVLHLQPLYVDHSFFDVFTFPLIQGNPKQVLGDVSFAVLTESTAKKFFNSTDVVGKILQIDADPSFEKLQKPLMVSGVVKDPPANSSLQFDVLFTFDFMQLSFNDKSWLNDYLGTFVILNPLVDKDKMLEQFDDIYASHATVQLKSMDFTSGGYDPKITYGLQPMTDVHLNNRILSSGESGVTNGSSPAASYMFLGIAFFILVMASVNFINIGVANSLKRAKEVGVRKIAGSSKKQIIFQFLLESAMLCGIAFVLSIICLNFLLPLFNEVTGKQLILGNVFDLKLLFYFISLFVAVISLTGLYPAFVLSGFKPVEALYNKQKLSGSNLFGRALVVFQFSLAVFLLVATMVYHSQMSYIQNKDLGYNPNNIIRTEFGGARDYKTVHDFFKDELLRESSIKAVSFGNDGWGRDVSANNHSIRVTYKNIDENFLPVMGIAVRRGRNLSQNFPGDAKTGAIVNEAFVKAANMKNAIGQTITFNNGDIGEKIIRGVVSDFHFGSLRDRITPLLMYMNETPDGGIWIKFDKRKQKEALAATERIYKKAIPGAAYRYDFLDELNEKQYLQEQRWQKVINIATAISFIICCLGLFALAHLSTNRRVKEIGIRKVLGATVIGITQLLTKDFLRLVIIAIAFATPVAWIAMSKWLESFAYRVNVSVWIFIAAGIVSVLIALITISFQSIKAAIANPVKSLRTE